MLTPQSTISVDVLFAEACAGVIAELRECGYTIEGDSAADSSLPVAEPLRYRADPGGAMLTALTTLDGPSVQFTLEGDRFGMAGPTGTNDPLLWMRLVQLGFQLAQSYSVVPAVCDPVTGFGPIHPHTPTFDADPAPLPATSAGDAL
ncbi:hypothetical protein A5784_10115 [Mycobacterium sp. 852013-50091_SCH5140682]|nr:hypothetical protein A5784_10115 [Mycobacterium sp. 852013-50091_SCH5140682]